MAFERRDEKMQLNIENNVANIPDGYSEHVANRVLYAPSRSKNSERYDYALRSRVTKYRYYAWIGYNSY